MPLLRHNKKIQAAFHLYSCIITYRRNVVKKIRTFVCKFLREILLTCLYLSYLLQYNKREERYGCESILASDFSGILLKYS